MAPPPVMGKSAGGVGYKQGGQQLGKTGKASLPKPSVVREFFLQLYACGCFCIHDGVVDDEDKAAEKMVRRLSVNSESNMFAVALSKRRQLREERTLMAQRNFRFWAMVVQLVYFFGWAAVYTSVMNDTEKCQDGDSTTHCQWSFLDSCYAVVVFTLTVGYGDYHFAGHDEGKKLLFIVQTAMGFILLSYIFAYGALVVRQAEGKFDFVVREEGEETHPRDDIKNTKKAMIISVVKVVVLFITGVCFFKEVESDQDLTWIDSLYFTWTTATTIGFGGITPSKDETKIFLIFYLVLSCSELSNLFGLVGTYEFTRWESQHQLKLMAVPHDGKRMRLFDIFNDGYVTAGEFLQGYLVSMHKVRAVTCKEILDKFRRLSMGKLYIDLDMFLIRSTATKEGMGPGMAAADQAAIDGASGVDQAKAAAVAAVDAVSKLAVNFPESKVEHRYAATAPADMAKLPDSIAPLETKFTFEELDQVDAEALDYLEKCLTRTRYMVQAVKNEKTKACFAAAASAGKAAQLAELPLEQVGECARDAAIAAGAWVQLADMCKDIAVAQESDLTDEEVEDVKEKRAQMKAARMTDDTTDFDL